MGGGSFCADMESSPRSAINRKNKVQPFCTVADIWVCLHLLVYAYTRLCMPTLACVHPEGFWEATYGALQPQGGDQGWRGRGVALILLNIALFKMYQNNTYAQIKPFAFECYKQWLSGGTSVFSSMHGSILQSFYNNHALYVLVKEFRLLQNSVHFRHLIQTGLLSSLHGPDFTILVHQKKRSLLIDEGEGRKAPSSRAESDCLASLRCPQPPRKPAGRWPASSHQSGSCAPWPPT